MSEKHKLAPAGQTPVAWARMKHGKIISVSHDKGVAEFLAGFAASELVPLYLQPQPADAALLEAFNAGFDAGRRVARAEAAVLVMALESIPEYWNQDNNEGAMFDAYRHAVNKASDALAAYHKQGGDT